MILVGLGVGIDYALLVFSRFRSELLAGADRETACAPPWTPPGGPCSSPGLTVIIALLGLVLLGIGSLQGVAVALAVTVLVTMLAALVLLPALLALVVAGWSAGCGAPGAPLARRASAGGGGATGPAAAVAGRAAAGRACSRSPRPRWTCGWDSPTPATTPPAKTSTQAYRLLAEGFGPGFNGPLAVVVAAPTAIDARPRPRGRRSRRPPASRRVTRRCQRPMARCHDHRLPRVAAAGPADRRPGEPAARRCATAAGPGQRRHLPGRRIHRGRVDFADAVADRLPLFLAVVVGLSGLLLLVLFRSLLIPVKAVLLNLLSVGASMGIITLVFQHGALGVAPGPIEAYVPVMIFAIVFGLSMDYEVFLLARMHEAWASLDASAAVSEGLATTGRVVTAAAAIMVVVFGSFLLAPDRMLQQFGLGLAVAVLLDAVVIRCLLLPAVMHLSRRPGVVAAVLARPAPTACRAPAFELTKHDPAETESGIEEGDRLWR